MTRNRDPATALADTFGSRPDDFVRLGRLLWDPIGRATTNRTSPQPGERVLDACCGAGASAVPAAEAVGPTGTVHAVDLAAPLLERLRVRADHLPQLTTHHRDVTMWKESSYDLVQCVLGIFFLPDMDAGVEALIGRLRPGGRVGLTIWRRPAMAAPGSALMRATSEVTGTPLAFDPGQHPEERINDAGSFTAWLGERGLRDVSVLEHELHLPWSRDLAWLLVTGSGFVGMLQGLDTEQVDDVRNRYLAILEVEGTETFDATTLIGIGTRP